MGIFSWKNYKNGILNHIKPMDKKITKAKHEIAQWSFRTPFVNKLEDPVEIFDRRGVNITNRDRNPRQTGIGSRGKTIATPGDPTSKTHPIVSSSTQKTSGKQRKNIPPVRVIRNVTRRIRDANRDRHPVRGDGAMRNTTNPSLSPPNPHYGTPAVVHPNQ